MACVAKEGVRRDRRVSELLFEFFDDGGRGDAEGFGEFEDG